MENWYTEAKFGRCEPGTPGVMQSLRSWSADKFCSVRQELQDLWEKLAQLRNQGEAEENMILSERLWHAWMKSYIRRRCFGSNAPTLAG
jgi:hypothetical protein